MLAGDTAQLLSKISPLISQVRSKYHAERIDLLAEIQEHLSVMRSGQAAALDAQGELRTLFLELNGRVSSMEAAAVTPHTPLGDLCAQAASLHETIRAIAEEQQLLKAALFHDRLVRAEGSHQRLLDEEGLQLRIRQAEESSEALRRQLQRWREINAATMENAVLLSQFVDDASTRNGQRSLLSLQEDVSSELGHVRSSHQDLRDRLSFISDVCAQLSESQHSRKSSADTVSKGNQSVTAIVANRESKPHKSQVRQRLRSFYMTYNPSKLGILDEILCEYDGATEELFAALEVQYGAIGYFSRF